jgi:hypothetical protein
MKEAPRRDGPVRYRRYVGCGARHAKKKVGSFFTLSERIAGGRIIRAISSIRSHGSKGQN